MQEAVQRPQSRPECSQPVQGKWCHLLRPTPTSTPTLGGERGTAWGSTMPAGLQVRTCGLKSLGFHLAEPQFPQELKLCSWTA